MTFDRIQRRLVSEIIRAQEANTICARPGCGGFLNGQDNWVIWIYRDATGSRAEARGAHPFCSPQCAGAWRRSFRETHPPETGFRADFADFWHKTT